MGISKASTYMKIQTALRRPKWPPYDLFKFTFLYIMFEGPVNSMYMGHR